MSFIRTVIIYRLSITHDAVFGAIRERIETRNDYILVELEVLEFIPVRTNRYFDKRCDCDANDPVVMKCMTVCRDGIRKLCLFLCCTFVLFMKPRQQ